jgi:hypothetical protein
VGGLPIINDEFAPDTGLAAITLRIVPLAG